MQSKLNVLRILQVGRGVFEWGGAGAGRSCIRATFTLCWPRPPTFLIQSELNCRLSKLQDPDVQRTQRFPTPHTFRLPSQVHKVANYCLSKLQDHDIFLDMAPQYLNRPLYDPLPMGDGGDGGGNGDSEGSKDGSLSGGGGGGGVPTRPALELLCNGMVSRLPRPSRPSRGRPPAHFIFPRCRFLVLRPALKLFCNGM
eukprot:130320-Chlamydomonas_euryale.AAC.1